MKTIGLFGTCDKSTWRDKFIETYDQKGIKYFNPVKKDWRPEDAKNEAYHLSNDDIIVFPITLESPGFASLAEIGFVVSSAILNPNKKVIIMIDPEYAPDFSSRPYSVYNSGALIQVYSEVEGSNRVRTLVKEHLTNINLNNIHVVDSLVEMLNLSVTLWEQC